MREPGFYWVKEHNQGWVIAEWEGGCWKFTSLVYEYEDTDIEEIDERRIVRENVEDHGEWLKAEKEFYKAFEIYKQEVLKAVYGH